MWLALTLLLVSAGAAQQSQAPNANWALADKFSPEALRAVTYSSSVNARFINKTDSAWYNWRDRNGSRFVLIVPATRTKKPLFDHVRFAAELSALHHRAFDPTDLPFTTIDFDSTSSSLFKFRVDSTMYSYDLRTSALKSLGRAPRGTAAGGRFGGEGRQGGGGGRAGGAGQDFRNFSPDSSAFVFAREHNLYYVEVATKDTVQVTKDGVKDYSYGARDTTQVQQQQQQDDQQGDQGQQGDQQARSRDPRVRANVSWSKDSKSFFVTRGDARKVADLYLLDMLAEPRPKLTTYKYPMPGEQNVRQQELNVFTRADKKVTRLDAIKKWKDQSFSDVHWDANGSAKIRLVRRDRLRQNMELVEFDLATNATKVLLAESVANATFEGSPVGNSYSARYVNAAGDFIWWSERNGWGHYYLYDHSGNLKNAITAGSWRADALIDVDSVKRVAYIRGVGREEGENVYQQHMYRVNLDGTGLALLDPGDANHTGTLSPSKRFVVDNFSRPDLTPKAVGARPARRRSARARGDGSHAAEGIGLEGAGDVCGESGGWRHGHLRQHVEAVRLRSKKEVPDHRERVSRPTDGERSNLVLGERSTATARATRLHRDSDRQPGWQPAP